MLQGLGFLDPLSPGVGLPLILGVSAATPEDDAHLHVDLLAENRYHVVLRGTFHLVWEPRDGFEKWLLILFLRRLQRGADTAPVFSQSKIAAVFGSSQHYVSRWERLVAKLGWHALSDRYRHQQRSRLPDAELSQAILKIWVPAFWLSAWDVRERLIQTQVILRIARRSPSKLFTPSPSIRGLLKCVIFCSNGSTYKMEI